MPDEPDLMAELDAADRAISTEDELKRSAAEAIVRGDYVTCEIPEPGE